MAKSVITQVTDDIDGSGDAETVSFGLHGVAYSIDLGPKNQEKLAKALAPFIERATRHRDPRMINMRKSTPKTERPYDLVALREWAGKHKIAVPARGRIPAAVVQQYQAAGGR